MKKLGRIVLLFLAAMASAAVLILLALNLYVQSQGTQARIQQELSQRIGATLRVRRISVTPWGGLKLSGITIPQSQPDVPGDFLSAKAFRLRIRFASLFSQRLVIKEISLINPDVIWAQNADGKWRLPGFPEEGASSGPDGEAVQTSLQIGARETAPPVIVANPSPVPSSSAFKPEVQRVNLIRGRFRFLDQKLKSVATFEQVGFRSNFRTENDLRGNISIAKTSLRDRFFLQDLQSPVQYDSSGINFSAITSRAGGGEITGHFAIQPQTEDSPFTASVNFRGIEADRIVTEAGGAAGIITGKLEGSLEASGKTADVDALTGTGEIALRDARVQQYSLLVALGQLLQIEELRQLHLDQAQIKFHIDPGVVTIDELLFRSQNIRLSATGTVSFDGKLHLESQLALNEKTRSQLFRAIRDNFQPSEEPGYSAVGFQVTGTVGRPKTNLMDKLIGRDLKDLGSVLKGFIGGKSDKKKKKEAEEAAEAAGSASAETSPAPGEAALASPTPSATP